MLYRVPQVQRFVAAFAVLSAAACDESAPEPSAFELKFAVVDGDDEVDCKSRVGGLGPNEDIEAGLNDLRFFVSNVRLYDSAGDELEVELDENPFQYADDTGQVSLVDLTDTKTGSCSKSKLAFAEGTSRTHDAITGTTLVEDVRGVAFDVGVPQALMKEVIANNTIEGAPSPLGELEWSWASGYRHFVFNFTVEDEDGQEGEGYVHLGSRACGAEGKMALEDRKRCDYVNTATVMLEDFDLGENSVGIDLQALLADLPFVADVYDPDTYEVIGESLGVSCHSSPMQTDCPSVFDNVGIDIDNGKSAAQDNQVFVKRKR